MTIQGQYYKPKVVVPTPKELINLDCEELHRIQKLQLKRGDEFQKEGSRFTAYVAKIDDVQQIREMYIKMKIIQPAARHIPCAYWLPGQQQKHYNQSFVDDGEPGSGRVLLNVLLDKELEGYVVFGVRKYGGVKIGTDRFTCYAMAAYSALGLDPDSYQRGPTHKRQRADQQTKVKSISNSQESLNELRDRARDSNEQLLHEYGASSKSHRSTASHGPKPNHPGRGHQYRQQQQTRPARGHRYQQQYSDYRRNTGRGGRYSSYRGQSSRGNNGGISKHNRSSSSSNSDAFNYTFSSPMQVQNPFTNAPLEDWSAKSPGHFEH